MSYENLRIIMTIDEFLIRDTDSLVLPDKKFYPLKIPIAHPQLRHFVNAQEPDLIYYASGHDIYCLNTDTKTRTHIYHVPFDCRCTAAGYGWICVAGGDKGNFTIIQLDNGASEQPTDVDTLLPLGLSDRTLGRPTPGLSPPKVKVENIGGDIINSITIHKLYGDEEDTSEEVVAIITSNDRTIRMYSLTYDQEVALLELPFPMNHATISPDGDLLIAVGDYNQAYFYERLEAGSKDAQAPPTHSKASNWEIMNIVQLHSPKDANTLGYFTTAWSPSGSLCAVGSECGYVTIFDTELIRTADWGEEAIVEICQSTRADKKPGPGAIRSMMFSPQPWDLLIWAEDRGRIVIADVRAGLKVRQVIKLDPNESHVEKVEIQDFSNPHLQPDSSHLRDPHARAIQGQLRALTQQVENLRQYRLALDADVDLAAATMSSEFLELLSERRRLQRLAAAVEADPNGLTAEERQILGALQTTEGRTEERDFGASRPRSVSYARADGPATAESAERRSTALGDEFPFQRSEGRLPSLASIHDYMREREADPNRHPYQPRRQASVVLSADHAGNGPSSNGASSHPSTIPPHLRSSDSPSLTDAMRTIEAEWARSRSPPSYTSGVRPHTPPPLMGASGHLLNDSSRPSTSDSTTPPSPDDSPLRRRTPAFRALEAHHQLSQLRHSSAAAAASTSSPAPVPHSPSPPIAVRPTSSNSTTTAHSPPRLRSSGGLSRRTSNPRSRSRSRVSDRQVRLEDYEARVRYMARYTDPQTVGFLQRRAALYESPDCGDKTAGLAMSADGGKLWCASEKGILEVKVDLWGRRVWAAEKFA